MQIREWRQAEFWWRVFGVAALFVLIFGLFERNLDPDFGWHLVTGRYVLAHGGVPAHDLFSYTAPNFPWIDHEWLSDVITAKLFSISGFGLVAAFFAAVWVAAIVIASSSWEWMIWLLGVGAIANEISARPTAWTGLGLAILMFAVKRKWYWQVVPLFLVWSNLHGGFVIGFVVLALAAIWNWRWWIVLLSSILASFINPYGPRLYVEIWRTLSDPVIHRYIAEWAPLSLDVMSGLIIVAYLFVVLWRGFRMKDDILALVLLVSGLSSARQFPLFVLAALSPIAQTYTKYFHSLMNKGQIRIVLPILACILVFLQGVGADIPVKELLNLKAEPCQGRLFNDYDYGGYVIWLLPGTKVFIDGRMASWRSGGTDYLELFESVLNDKTVANETFSKYGITCALLEKKHARLANQLKAEGWKVTASGPAAEVLRKSN